MPSMCVLIQLVLLSILKFSGFERSRFEVTRGRYVDLDAPRELIWFHEARLSMVSSSPEQARYCWSPWTAPSSRASLAECFSQHRNHSLVSLDTKFRSINVAILKEILCYDDAYKKEHDELPTRKETLFSRLPPSDYKWARAAESSMICFGPVAATFIAAAALLETFA